MAGDISTENRKGYSMLERRNILRYIIEKDGYSDVKGRRFWVDFAESGKTTRTWQSLKEVFKKRILTDLHNPYFGLTNAQIKNFASGSKNNIDSKVVKWSRKCKISNSKADGPVSIKPSSPHGTKIAEHKNSILIDSEPMDICPIDSDADIDFANKKSTRFIPAKADSEHSFGSSSVIQTSVAIVHRDPVVSPDVFYDSPEDIQNKENHQSTPEIKKEHESQIINSDKAKSSFLLLDSDSDDSETPFVMNESRHAKNSLFGFSTGRPIIISNNSLCRGETNKNSEDDYRREFQPSSSKQIAFSTPSKRPNAPLKISKHVPVESSTDCESLGSSDSDPEYSPMRKEEGRGKGQKMYCALDGNLLQLYQPKHKACSQRSKIYTHYEDKLKHKRRLLKKQKSIYIDDRTSPAKGSRNLMVNPPKQIMSESDAGILNYWKMKYYAEKKRANDLFRIVSSEKNSESTNLFLQTKMEQPTIRNNVANENKKRVTVQNIMPENSVRSTKIVSHAKGENVQGKRENLVENVIYIDTQKADILFDILKKFSDTKSQTNGLEKQTNENKKSPDIKAKGFIDVKPSITSDDVNDKSRASKTKSPTKPHDSSPLRHTRSRAPSNSPMKKKTQQEEINELFRSQEKKETSIIIEDESLNDTQAIKSVREKEKKIFEQILAENSRAEKEINRNIFTDQEVKMLSSPNKKDGSLKVEKNAEENDTNLLKKRGRKRKIITMEHGVAKTQSEIGNSSSEIDNSQSATRRSFRNRINGSTGKPLEQTKDKLTSSTRGYNTRPKITSNSQETSPREKINKKIIDFKEDKFKINPKFPWNLILNEEKTKSEKEEKDNKVIPSTDSDSDDHTRYQFPDSLKSSKWSKNRRSEGKIVDIKWFTNESTIDQFNGTTYNVNSKRPTAKTYYNSNSSHLAQLHTPYLFNTENENYFCDDNIEHFRQWGSSTTAKKRKINKVYSKQKSNKLFNKSSILETSYDHPQVESQEIPFQTNIFALENTFINYACVKNHNLKDSTAISLSLPPMEQEQKITCKTILDKTEKNSDFIEIDVLKCNSQSQKDSEYLKKMCLSTIHSEDENNEIVMTESLAPCIDHILPSTLPISEEKPFECYDREIICKTNSTNTVNDHSLQKEESLTDSFISKSKTSMLDIHNSADPTPSMKSADAAFEEDELNIMNCIEDKKGTTDRVSFQENAFFSSTNAPNYKSEASFMDISSSPQSMKSVISFNEELSDTLNSRDTMFPSKGNPDRNLIKDETSPLLPASQETVYSEEWKHLMTEEESF